MSDLTQDADALIRAGRTAFRPGAADRDRVLASLSAALGENALVDGARQGGRANAAAGSRLALKSWLLAGLAAVALGTGGVVAPRLWPRAPSRLDPARATLASSAVEMMASARPSEARDRTQNLTPARPSEARDRTQNLTSDIGPTPDRPRAGPVQGSPRSGSRSSARQAPDSLAEEVRLLSRAEQQMNDGLAGDALQTLAEHERRFPAGSLAEERMAARVQALCALGRTAEARSDLTSLMRTYPRSAHLERARRVCGIDVGPAP